MWHSCIRYRKWRRGQLISPIIIGFGTTCSERPRRLRIRFRCISSSDQTSLQVSRLKKPICSSWRSVVLFAHYRRQLNRHSRWGSHHRSSWSRILKCPIIGQLSQGLIRRVISLSRPVRLRMKARGHTSSRISGSWRSTTFSCWSCWLRWRIRGLRRWTRGYLNLLRWRPKRLSSQITSSWRDPLQLTFRRRWSWGAPSFGKFSARWLPSSWQLWSLMSGRRATGLGSLWVWM